VSGEYNTEFAVRTKTGIYVGEKYKKLLTMKEAMDFEVYWDGACTLDKIEQFAPMGVKGFVLGTTLLFGKGKPYGEVLKNIRELKF
jgi:ribulose-phosphate 3-epimerase